MFWVLTLCQIYNWQNSLPLCGLPHHSINCFLPRTKHCSFMKFHLSIIGFYSWANGVLFRKSFSIPIFCRELSFFWQLQAKIYFKRFYACLVAMEMQIITSLRFHLILVSMAKIKKTTKIRGWQGYGKRGALIHLYRLVPTCAATLEIRVEKSQKIESRYTKWPSYPTPWHTSEYPTTEIFAQLCSLLIFSQ